VHDNTDDHQGGKRVEVAPDELKSQVSALTSIADKTNELVASARKLAERNPMLGTAPPAMNIGKLLRAGGVMLTAEIDAAETELASFHRALHDTVVEYEEGDRAIAWRFTKADQKHDAS
jgi:hypothetical protein